MAICGWPCSLVLSTSYHTLWTGLTQWRIVFFTFLSSRKKMPHSLTAVPKQRRFLQRMAQSLVPCQLVCTPTINFCWEQLDLILCFVTMFNLPFSLQNVAKPPSAQAAPALQWEWAGLVSGKRARELNFSTLSSWNVFLFVQTLSHRSVQCLLLVYSGF